MKELLSYSIRALHALMEKRELSGTEITTAYLDNIETQDKTVRAYLTLTRELALKSAKAADKKRKEGCDPAPLAGIPAAVKDNICTRGVRTTCASRMLENFVPCYDATVIERLKKQDYVLLGKVNMDEFAMGSTTESSAFMTTANPRDPTRVPGGSSGGSAAAVAANQAVYSLGSDTGGSVRQPAALCGVVGMRPTYGMVSRYGLIAFSSSLDQIGPITKDVTDNALVLAAISGHDKRDATSVKRRYGDLTKGIETGADRLKIAFLCDFPGEEISPGVKCALFSAAKLFSGLGAHVEEVSMPSVRDSIAAYCVISSAEASSNLARFDGVRYGSGGGGDTTLWQFYKQTRGGGFGEQVKRRVLFGTLALGAGSSGDCYQRAMLIKAHITREYARLFKKYDLLLSPAACAVARKIGEGSASYSGSMYPDICTVSAGLAGLPALSIPCGRVGGLPVGMQLTGKRFSEAVLYRAGYAFETANGGRFDG